MKNLFSHFALALTFVACGWFAPRAHAQCTPDGLDGGPCCAPAAVNLPVFPLLTGDAQFLCFDSCQPALSKTYCTILGQPQPERIGGVPICGHYLMRIQLRDCATGQLAWAGLVRATYSRNWLEAVGPAGPDLTVYRFILNGDFKATPAAGTSPCDRPACLGPYTRIYFSGHIDYALDCATGAWSVAWALSHECDAVHHPPGSLRPAPATGLHPGRSFAMVGPGAGFVPSSTTPIVSNGTIAQGGFRFNDWSAAPAVCVIRETAFGNLTPVNDFCMCPSAVGGAPQYADTFVGAQGICGSSLSSVAGASFVQKRLGMWTAASVFPGPEILLFDYGDLVWTNGCNGVTSAEWYEGSETIGGYPAFDFAGTLLGRQFEDIASSNQSATSMARRIGTPHVSYSIFAVNLP